MTPLVVETHHSILCVCVVSSRSHRRGPFVAPAAAAAVGGGSSFSEARGAGGLVSKVGDAVPVLGMPFAPITDHQSFGGTVKGVTSPGN